MIIDPPTTKHTRRFLFGLTGGARDLAELEISAERRGSSLDTVISFRLVSPFEDLRAHVEGAREFARDVEGLFWLLPRRYGLALEALSAAFVGMNEDLARSTGVRIARDPDPRSAMQDAIDEAARIILSVFR